MCANVSVKLSVTTREGLVVVVVCVWVNVDVSVQVHVGRGAGVVSPLPGCG